MASLTLEVLQMALEMHGMLFQRKLQPDCVHTSRNSFKKLFKSMELVIVERPGKKPC